MTFTTNDYPRLWRMFLLSSVLVGLIGCGPAQVASPAPPIPITATPAPVMNTQTPTSEPITPTMAPTATAVPTGTPVPFSTVATGIEYVLPPVIQHVSETRAVIFFELPTPREGVIVAQAQDAATGESVVMPFEPTETRQQIVLENLLPDTSYTVQIGVDETGDGIYEPVNYSGEPWGPLTVSTLSDNRRVKVGVFGDSGFGSQVTYDLAARLAQEDIDFVIHTGDTVYKIGDNADPFEAFRLKWYLPLKPLLTRLPIYPVVGNHDVEAATLWEGQPFYYRAFPPFTDPDFVASDNDGKNQWYAFGVGKVQFVMLDSQTFFGESGHDAQEAWLAERLADDRFEHTIVAFHVPPYTSSRHRFDGQSPQFFWVPQFEASNVRLVLGGHSHNYERLIYNEITYIVSGGGSEVLYALQAELPFSESFAAVTHYVVLDVGPEQIGIRAVSVTGDVLDEGVVPLP